MAPIAVATATLTAATVRPAGPWAARVDPAALVALVALAPLAVAHLADGPMQPAAARDLRVVTAPDEGRIAGTTIDVGLTVPHPLRRRCRT